MQKPPLHQHPHSPLLSTAVTTTIVLSLEPIKSHNNKGMKTLDRSLNPDMQVTSS